jgi:hypothetical protein
MTQRLGQKLINVISFKLSRDEKLPANDPDILRRIFFMSDTEFMEIINMTEDESIKFYDN